MTCATGPGPHTLAAAVTLHQPLKEVSMIRTAWLSALVLIILTSGGTASGRQDRQADLRRQVADTERAFAKTMADRDFAAFQTFLASDAIFLGERLGPSRGKAQVAEAWKRFFEPAAAPFSWRPEIVEVLESGTLALSSGPVFDPQGTQIGTFNSIWRLEADGKWRVIFDKGCPPCK